MVGSDREHSQARGWSSDDERCGRVEDRVGRVGGWDGCVCVAGESGSRWVNAYVSVPTASSMLAEMCPVRPEALQSVVHFERCRSEYERLRLRDGRSIQAADGKRSIIVIST